MISALKTWETRKSNNDLITSLSLFSRVMSNLIKSQKSETGNLKAVFRWDKGAENLVSRKASHPHINLVAIEKKNQKTMISAPKNLKITESPKMTTKGF